MRERLSRLALAVALAAAAFGAQAAEEAKTAAAGSEDFAVVGTARISHQDYANALNATMRQKFYHGSVPEGQVAALQREVADRLVDRILLAEEVKRRNIEPDRDAVEREIAGYEARYAKSAQWQANRERLLPGLREQLEQQSRLARLEEATRKVPAPSEAEAKKFYDSHPELFTEPEKVRLSVILLKVDPASPQTAWNAALEEATSIRARIEKGADFAELAKMHSADGSAKDGGDMGYLHRGMLPDGLHENIDQLKPNVVSEPIRMLEGMALFKLTDRKAPNKRSFADVKQRATDLAQRDKSNAAWDALLASLRRATPVKLDTQRYPALAEVKSSTR